MPYKPLTEAGKIFIKKICEGNNNSLLKGVSYYRGKPVGLPFSNEENNPKIWISNSKDQYKKNIVTNEQLGNAIIYWFEKYSKLYDLDSNIISAQAYQESKYNIWIYNATTSTASGISQFVMPTTYEIMIKNGGYNIVEEFTKEEKARITKNISGNTQSALSYSLIGGNTSFETRNLAKYNRGILHQNIIDNPDLSIKAQCRLMKYIAIRNNNLASSTLFAYSRGALYSSKTYTEIIEKVKKDFGNDYIQEGLNYVKNIFGYLGDQNNQYIKPLPKPQSYWFGYKNLNLGLPFNAFDATTKESNLKFGNS